MIGLDAKTVRELLAYDSDTGAFIWRVKLSRKVVAGRRAGCVSRSGYVLIGIAGKVYYAHRLAWLWMTGEWPALIDHKDGDRTNNRWSNLRVATMPQNILNSRRAASNTSGFKGVSWSKACSKWSAAIHISGKKRHIGVFEKPEDAHAAYLAVAREIDTNFARGE